ESLTRRPVIVAVCMSAPCGAARPGAIVRMHDRVHECHAADAPEHGAPDHASARWPAGRYGPIVGAMSEITLSDAPAVVVRDARDAELVAGCALLASALDFDE